MLKDLRPGAASGGKTEREAAAVTPPQDPQKTKTEAQSGQLRGGNFILNYVGALTRKTGRAYSLRLLYAARRRGLKFRGEVMLHLFLFFKCEFLSVRICRIVYQISTRFVNLLIFTFRYVKILEKH